VKAPSVELTDEQVRGYAASALANPVLMGAIVELQAEALRDILGDADFDATNRARG
jgi:hypothetical protein